VISILCHGPLSEPYRPQYVKQRKAAHFRLFSVSVVRTLGPSVSRILITGGTGFVGRHLIQFLKSSTSRIAVLASGGSPSPEPNVDYYEVDIRDQGAVRAVVQKVEPHQIYHLAGVSTVDESWSNPQLTYEVNVFGANNLFNAAMSLPSPPRILNVSTSQVYSPSSHALSEDSPVQPDNPYAASKAMAELLVVGYQEFKAGGIITARAFNHTGPGQPPNFVLPSLAKQFAEIEAGLQPPNLTVGNVEVKRDFTDVRDVVRAYCMLLDKGRTGEIYNVCSGSAIRLADIIQMFESVSGIHVTIETEVARVRCSDVLQMCGNPKKIREVTGWYPQISLQDTIAAVLDHWRSRFASLPKT
jgi:GDP-4-dehydro-6-deoxy-D-mannose reductase